MTESNGIAGEADLSDRLQQAAARHFGNQARVAPVSRPSMGGSNDTLVFDLTDGAASRRLVLRQETYTGAGNPYLPPSAQYRLLEVARAHHIPVPEPVFELTEADDLGRGFVMAFVDGETLPRRIVRDPAFEEARPALARQCGEVLARLHAVDTAAVDFLRDLPDSIDPLATQRQRLDAFAEAHPALELGLRWLERNRPAAAAPCLLHGDFRNGNLIVGPEGLRAVLDWECSHLGDPFEDLAWLCLRSWRFGRPDRPVGGFGERAPYYAAYRQVGGGAVDPGTVRYWEIYGFVRWAILNVMQGYGHVEEGRSSIVYAACGRNVAMMEYDLLMTLDGVYD